ncbi:MAG: hypothetical protein ACK5Q5_12610 [Planctomycetaceae bacterium]
MKPVIPSLWGLWLFALFSAAETAAAWLLLAVEEPLQSSAFTMTLWRDPQFLAICTIGSLAGSFLALAVVYGREDRPHGSGLVVALTGLTCWLCGMICGPVSILWMGWPMSDVTLIPASAVSAFVGPASIEIARPIYRHWLKRKLTKLFGLDKEQQ